MAMQLVQAKANQRVTLFGRAPQCTTGLFNRDRFVGLLFSHMSNPFPGGQSAGANLLSRQPAAAM